MHHRHEVFQTGARMSWFMIGWIILSLLGIIRLLVHRRDPYAMLAWGLLILFIPFVGATAFFMFGPQRLMGYGTIRKRRIEAAERRRAIRPDMNRRDQQIESLRPYRVASALSRRKLSFDNAVTFYPSTEQTLDVMCNAVNAAKKFVHLEYFIVELDHATDKLFKCLAEASDRGVEVRLLYDVHGSLAVYRRGMRPLERHGVKVAGFLPTTDCLRRLNVNFRNHRKAIIVDGRTLITGGSNLSRRYLGSSGGGDCFHDYTIRVDGPAVHQANDVFVRDWLFATKEDLFNDRYFPAVEACGQWPIFVLEGFPDRAPSPLFQTLLELMACAEKELLIVTPYLVPDRSFLAALQLAARRGCRVELLLPARGDIRVVQYAVESYYEELLGAGIQIHLYDRKILHAKLMVVDRRWTLFGSANLDMRSFWLNFELSFLAYGEGLAEEARQIILADTLYAQRMTHERYEQRPFHSRLLESACRLAAPIM
jgi:cardiolipin synthase